MNVCNGNDPFAAISTSPEVLATLRRRMTAIEQAADTLQVYLASERAQGVIDALEVLRCADQVSQNILAQMLEQAFCPSRKRPFSAM